jgi:hypothetical protein
LIFAHSNRPIDFFARNTGSKPIAMPQPVEWQGHSFTLVSRPGPLWSCSIEKASAIGSELAALVSS